MKTNYEVRYAAHPADAKGYDTERLRRDFLIERVLPPTRSIWYIRCMTA